MTGRPATPLFILMLLSLIAACVGLGMKLERGDGTPVNERSRCVESGRIALVREVAGEVVVTACLTVDEIERVGSS